VGADDFVVHAASDSGRHSRADQRRRILTRTNLGCRPPRGGDQAFLVSQKIRSISLMLSRSF
jgi:hypothetical protein